MGDRSKIEARKAEIARQFEEAKRASPEGNAARCRSCKKAQREVAVMVKMGGFRFCSECFTGAYSLVRERNVGR
jgi:hypothetical protein